MVRMIAASAAAVATVFSRSWMPASVDSRLAAMPEPTTANEQGCAQGFGARSSGQRRRSRTRCGHPAQHTPASGVGVAPTGAACGLDPAKLPVRRVAVAEHRVDLPWRTVGIVDPDLVLHRVATGHVVLGCRGQALGRQASGRGRHLIGRAHLDPEVVQAPAMAGVLDQDQFQRWLGDGEVGVAGLGLSRARWRTASSRTRLPRRCRRR